MREPRAANVTPVEAAVVRSRGAALLGRLHGVLRGLRLYDAANRVQRQYQGELLDAVRAMASDEVTLVGLGEYVYVNGVRLRPEGAQLPIFQAVLAALQVRRVSGLRFRANLEAEELEAFMREFHAHDTDGAADALEEFTERSGGTGVGVIVARSGSGGGVDGITTETGQHRTRLVFGRAVDETRALMMESANASLPRVRQARRVVQPLVDRLLRHDGSLIGLTALKRHDEYTYAHCVNVTILSIRIGQWLGLTRSELATVGVCALLHDTGKLLVPPHVLSKPGRLDDAEWTMIRRHPLEGLRIMSRQPGLSEIMVDAMRVAFEHHMHVDHSGYPRVREPRPMAPFSRIVEVADVFDAVTANRAYRKRPLTPHEALRLLVGHERHHFDPAVLWGLVQAVGLYPAGTVLRTESGRTWLSIAPGPESPMRPVCRELRADGSVDPEALVLEQVLPEDDPVAHVLAPEEFPVDVDTLLAA